MVHFIYFLNTWYVIDPIGLISKLLRSKRSGIASIEPGHWLCRSSFEIQLGLGCQLGLSYGGLHKQIL
jgi:hypothetical protein